MRKAKKNTSRLYFVAYLTTLMVFSLLAVGSTSSQPSLTTPTTTGHPPNDPATVNQFRIYADALLPESGNTTENAIRFRAMVSDPDGDSIKLQIELRKLSDSFTGVPTTESSLTGSGSQVTVTQLGVAFGDYKWAYRAVDASGLTSAWTEFGTAGNRDFSRTSIPNDYVRIDQVYRHEDEGKPYIYMRWTLLRKWNETPVAVYPSINDNLPSITLSSSFEPILMGGNFFSYDQFSSLGMNLDQGHIMWKLVGPPCNNAGPGAASYRVEDQYTTRFSKIFDMSTFSWIDAANVTPATNIKFTIYDRTQFDSSQCNMDFKEAFPDGTDYHIVQDANLNNSPNSPTSVNQFRIYADAILQETGTTTESAVRFKANVTDPDGDSVKLQIELRPVSESFTGTPTIESNVVTSGSQVIITNKNLAFGNYKWAYRAMDISGRVSPWVEFGAAGNVDFTRLRLLNDYVRMDDIYKELADGTQYIYVKWTLLKKWNDAEVAVYPSLNDNLPSITLSSYFEPLFMGGNFFGYDQFRSLGKSLDQGYYMWKPVGSPCNDAGPGQGDYIVGSQYTTRFSKVFNISTFSWVDATNITATDNIRFTVYDRTQFDASPCNMDFKEAYPDSADYHLQTPTPTPTPSPSPSPSPTPQRRPLIFIPGITGSQLNNFPALAYNPNPLWPSLGHFLPSGTFLPGNPYLLDRKKPVAGANIKAVDVIRRTPSLLGDNPVYESLLGTLGDHGYTEYVLDGNPERLSSSRCDFEGQKDSNPSLFVFPYDWRLSNSENAALLKDYIGCIRRFYPDPNIKIDVVTHSMGGLLARSYLLQNQDDHHIGKLITIAAPWLGAPKATRVLVAGDVFDSRVLNFFTRSSLKSLSEFFPSVHELMPSKSYYELIGAPPPYILNGKILNYEQTTALLDTRFSDSRPGNTNRAFHQSLQDDWHDPSHKINTSVEYYHLYGVKTGTADTVGIVVEERLQSCPPLLPCFTFHTLFKVGLTAGDGTVPTLSALRTDSLNPPGVSRASGRIKGFYCPNGCDHIGLAQKDEVKSEILKILQSAATSDPNKNGQLTIDHKMEDIVDPEIHPAYYLTVIGTASASIQENFREITDPLADPSDNNAPDITSYVIGDKAFTAILPVGQTYVISLRSGPNPMIIELKKGNNTVTTQAIRYQDFSVPSGVILRLQINPQSADALRYDADGDGTFETTVAPTATVSGIAAQDVDPPILSVNEERQQEGVLLSLKATDSGSGIKAVYYSLDGTNFQPYTSAFIVDPYRTPLVYAFADDNVANRSGVTTFQLTAPASALQFNQTTASIGEAGKQVDIAVNRVGDTSGVATISYATSDTLPVNKTCQEVTGIASLRCDYAATTGTLQFASGESSKLISIPIVEDNIYEGNENFTITLSNPSGASLGPILAATITITDNEAPPSPLYLMLDQAEPNQAAALDSILFLRDPFPIINNANVWNQGTDKNTRVIIFVMNLQLASGETSSSVLVNLIDSNNQIYEIVAEDIRIVPGFSFTQVIFRLPDNLAPGTGTIKIKAHGQESNPGTIRIRT